MLYSVGKVSSVMLHLTRKVVTHIWAASARSDPKPRRHSEIGDRSKTLSSSNAITLHIHRQNE